MENREKGRISHRKSLTAKEARPYTAVHPKKY